MRQPNRPNATGPTSRRCWSWLFGWPKRRSGPRTITRAAELLTETTADRSTWPPPLDPIAPPPNLPTRRDSERTDPTPAEQAKTARRSLLRRTLGDPAWMRRHRTSLQIAAAPALFRSRLRIGEDPEQTLGRLMQPFQRDDFAAIDPAWLRVTGWDRTTHRKSDQAATPIRRFWLERPRGHSKTTDTAAMLLWALAFARTGIRGVAAAADRDQARLILDQMGRLVALNPMLRGRIRFGRDQARVTATGSRLEVLSSDAASSYGTIADFIICDELCHWARPELWHSLYTAAAKQPHTILAVLTNAGSGRDWRWTARETARRSRAWHFHSLDGPQAAWIDGDFLAEQRASLPPAVFDRLWLNRWQTSSGGFLQPAEVAACRDDTLTPQDRGRRDRTYLAAIDYAEKHDRTVAVVAHIEPADVSHPRPRVVVDRMDVVAPTPERPVPIAWVESWIGRMADAFPGLRLVVDEHQLLGTVQRMAGRLPIERFAFAGGLGNDALARNLRSMVLARDVRWYAGCGSLGENAAGERDDLERELCDLLVVERSRGRLRFDHPPGRHDDRAFALAVACLHLMRSAAAEETFAVEAWDGRRIW